MLRAQHGARWTPVASVQMNVAYRQNIQLYGTKIDQAKSQDALSFAKYQEQKAELEILGKTPQELAAMMPSSDSAQNIADAPVSKAIKTALDNLDSAKTRKDELLKEIVECLANMNVVEELMEVHQGHRAKEEFFTGKKQEYNEKFSRLAE